MKNNSRTKGKSNKTGYRTPSSFKSRPNTNKVVKQQIVRRTHM